MKWAGDFAKAYGAQLNIVHAVPFVVPTAWEYNFPNLQQELVDWSRQRIDNIRQRIDSIQASLSLGAQVNVVMGEPARVVREAAEAAHGDLLVIGRSIPDGLVGRLRTHAYPIIRQSPCPVISV